MGTITLPKTWSAEILTASDLNASFVEVRDKFNTYAVLTDTAKTITVTHTWERTQTFTPSSGVGINVTTGGISVTGTAALAAVTCTTVTASGAISGTTGTFSSTLQGGQTVQAVAGTVTSRLSADSGNGWGTLGTYSNHAFKFVSNSITRGQLTAAGVFELDSITAQSITVSGGTTAVGAFTATTGSFSSTLAVTGAATFANNVTISGTMLIAGGSGSASTIIRNATTGLTLQGYAGSSYDMVLADAAGTNRWALTSSGTILANAAMTVTSTVTLPATGATYALDFTGAAGRLRLSNNGSLTVVENDGSTAIMTITESTGGVAFAGAVTGVGATFSGEVRVGSTTALAASATSGFFWMPSMNGTPIGSPTETGDRVAVIYNYSANKVWFYNPTDNTWRGVNVT